MEWQPIETALNESSSFLVVFEDGYVACFRTGEDLRDYEKKGGPVPIGWLPRSALPPAPARGLMAEVFKARRGAFGVK